MMESKYHFFIDALGAMRKGKEVFKFELDILIDLRCKVKRNPLWYFEVTNKDILIIETKRAKELQLRLRYIPVSDSYSSYPDVIKIDSAIEKCYLKEQKKELTIDGGDVDVTNCQL